MMIDKDYALLFDLGGVIVDIRREDCVEAFEKLGFADIADYLGDYGQKGPFLLVEEGKISVEEFRAEMRSHIPHAVCYLQHKPRYVAWEDCGGVRPGGVDGV